MRQRICVGGWGRGGGGAFFLPDALTSRNSRAGFFSRNSNYQGQDAGKPAPSGGDPTPIKQGGETSVNPPRINGINRLPLPSEAKTPYKVSRDFTRTRPEPSLDRLACGELVGSEGRRRRWGTPTMALHICYAHYPHRLRKGADMVTRALGKMFWSSSVSIRSVFQIIDRSVT